jgi:hypothetical protein
MERFTTGHFLKWGSETRFLAEECGFFAPQRVSKAAICPFRQAKNLVVPLLSVVASGLFVVWCHCERSEAISCKVGDCFVALLLAMTSSNPFKGNNTLQGDYHLSRGGETV